jgi:Holliday junction resolvase
VTPEGVIKKQVKSILAEVGAWYCMPVGSGYGKSAIPDFIVCHQGYLIAIETKAGNKQATAIQAREIERIKTAKGFAFVINETNIGHLKEWLLLESTLKPTTPRITPSQK